MTHDCGTTFTQPVLPLCVSQETYLADNNYSYVVYVQSKCTYANANQLLLTFKGTPYGCSDGHAVVTDGNWTLLCPPTEEVVLQTSLVINDDLPDTLAPAMRIGIA